MSDTPTKTIFYAWQAQRPEKWNRYLIEEALDRALKDLAQDDQTPTQFTLDQDARDALGAPEISAIILRKIEKCSVFVADVTPVGTLVNGRATPNPNVLFELGYAWHTIGENRIILVLNDAFGQPEDLPFDISKRALVRYRLDDPARAAEVRGNLAARLRSVISSMARDDHLRLLRESGLSETDIKLFTLVYSKMLEEDREVCGYEVLLEIGSGLGLGEQGVDDATQMLSDNDFWRASSVISPHRFSHVRASTRGLEQYCNAFLPAYSKLRTEIGRRILAGMTSSGEIAKATGRPEIIVEHVLKLLQVNDYIRVTESNAGTHVFEVKPKLKRAFGDSTVADLEKDAEPTAPGDGERRRA